MPADREFAASARKLRDFGRRSGLAGFVRWWSGELAPLVPRATRAAVKRRRMRPVLAFDATEATLWRPAIVGGESVLEPVARIALGGDPSAVAAAGRSAIDALRAGPGASVVIALPARQILRRTLVLPAAIEENLKQALAYDLDRHTPFKADELHFDAAVIGRDTARGEIRVDLAAARRAVVDQAMQQAESWGADVRAVVPDGAEAAAESRLNLLPDERRPVNGSWRRWQFWLPLVALVAVSIAAVVLPIWQKREYAIALHRAADAARAQAAISEGLRSELDRLTGDYNFALERKFAFPSAIYVVDEITKLLPDDTWLTQMELKSTSRGKDTQRELLLRGESGNAGRLITLFEESKVFTQAAPRSPTTKIQPGPGEIFDLVAQLRPLPPPAPVALAATAAAVDTPPTPTADAARPGAAAPPPASVAGTPPAPGPAAASGPAATAASGTASAPGPGAASGPPAGLAPGPVSTPPSGPAPGQGAAAVLPPPPSPVPGAATRPADLRKAPKS